MFSTSAGHSDDTRFRVAVQMLTVLSMVFFLMSLFLELEVLPFTFIAVCLINLVFLFHCVVSSGRWNMRRVHIK